MEIVKGENITWDYKDCYLYQEPIPYENMSFFPDRHNREFTREEVEILLSEGGFGEIEAQLFAEKKLRNGVDRINSIFSNLRDGIPTLRNHIIGFAVK